MTVRDEVSSAAARVRNQEGLQHSLERPAMAIAGRNVSSHRLRSFDFLREASRHSYHHLRKNQKRLELDCIHRLPWGTQFASHHMWVFFYRHPHNQCLEVDCINLAIHRCCLRNYRDDRCQLGTVCESHHMIWQQSFCLQEPWLLWERVDKVSNLNSLLSHECHQGQADHR